MTGDRLSGVWGPQNRAKEYVFRQYTPGEGWYAQQNGVVSAVPSEQSPAFLLFHIGHKLMLEQPLGG